MTTTAVSPCDGVPINSSIMTDSPLSRKNFSDRIRSRMFIFFAISDGSPEYTTVSQPQSIGGGSVTAPSVQVTDAVLLGTMKASVTLGVTNKNNTLVNLMLR